MWQVIVCVRALSALAYAYAWAWFSQVATGMSALHERKMLHGDLKTSNLLIERDGNRLTSIITDFGAFSVVTACH